MLLTMRSKVVFPVVFEEYSYNNIQNRIIKTTLNKIIQISYSKEILKLATYLDNIFSEFHVGHEHNSSIKWDSVLSNNEFGQIYERILIESRIILCDFGNSIYSGTIEGFVFLYKTDRIFEHYILNIFKKHNQGYKIKEKDNQYHLIEDYMGRKAFILIPDMLLYSDSKNTGKRFLCILDAKWKYLDFSQERITKISKTDLYQMYTYGKKYYDKASDFYPFTVLIYPSKGPADKPFRVLKFENNPDNTLYLILFAFDITKFEYNYNHQQILSFVNYIKTLEC
jgi:5-methylcytosine-specific restriction enzyme subunit McrC